MPQAFSVSLSAIVQVFILYLAIYAILKRAKGSRVGQALMGVVVLAALLGVFTFVFRFEVLARIVMLILGYLALSTVVIFQPEIRRGLAAVGAFGFLEKRTHDSDGAASAECFASAILRLADARMGALIAFERGISLRSYEETGVRLNADFTRELAETVFTPPLPLHDGGMTIRRGRISAAHCIFPVSNNPDLISSGMRHRAAVGLSEETDALVVVVSEERGTVSVAHNGKLFRYADEMREPALRRWIGRALADGTRGGGALQRLGESVRVKMANILAAQREDRQG